MILEILRYAQDDSVSLPPYRLTALPPYRLTARQYVSCLCGPMAHTAWNVSMLRLPSRSV